MLQKLKDNVAVFGMVFTAACAVLSIMMSYPFYADPKMQSFLFDAGVDTMGTLFAAGLYFGCMRQKGDGTHTFRILVVLISAGLINNEVLFFTLSNPELATACFGLTMFSKLLDLAIVYLFYRYLRETLAFKGKLAAWAQKYFPILMGLEAVLILSNIFYPTTFMIDAAATNEMYQATAFSWAEDIYIALVTILTTIMIIRSDSPRSQKTGGLVFMFIPIVTYFVLVGASFGNAATYGTALMSLIVVYCMIFNDKSSKLAATETELGMATQIQASMLPSIFPAFPTRDEFDLYAKMDPAKEVGGDFYDFFMIDDDHLGVVIADVSGKGVPAALFMMISKTIVQNYAMLGISPAEALTKANAALCAQNKMDMFVTVWMGILELSTGKMVCTSAGHEYPMIYHDGKFELFKDKHGLICGVMEGIRYKNYELQLEKDDKIFVYTDGVPEATNANGELFGFERTVEALNIEPEANPENILRIVRESVDEFVGEAEQFDDLTMVCVEYRGTKS